MNKEQQLEVAEGLVEIREKWKTEGWDIVMATCAEKIDLGKYEIERNRCIDIVFIAMQTLRKKRLDQATVILTFFTVSGRRIKLIIGR